MSWTLFLSIVSGILVIGAGIAQHHEKVKNDKEAQKNFDSLSKENKDLREQVKNNASRREQNENTIIELSKDLAAANKKLDEKSDQIIDSTNELNTAQKKLIKANEENSRLQNELYKQVAGDSSMPKISVLGNTRGGGDIKIVLSNPSKYPIANITVSAWELYPPLTIEEKMTSHPPNKEREIITSQRPLTLTAMEQNYLIDELSLGSPQGNPNEEHPVRTFTYTVKWRKGSYTCIIPTQWDHKHHGYQIYEPVYTDLKNY